MPDRAASHFVAIGDNTLDVYIDQGVMSAGGNALNVAAQWSAMGLPSRYLGAVGTDHEAEHVLAGVRLAGLSDSDVRRQDGRTGFTVIRLVNRDRQFLIDEFGVSATWAPDDEQVASLPQTSWIHVAGPLAGTALAHDWARGTVPVSVDVSTSRELPPVDGVSIVFASNGDTRGAEAEALAMEILRAGAKEAVVTCGSSGSLASTGSESATCDALPVDLVDTCGAGDSFIAAYVHARQSGATLPEALRAGTERATLACEYMGGFRQQPQQISDLVLERLRRSGA